MSRMSWMDEDPQEECACRRAGNTSVVASAAGLLDQVVLTIAMSSSIGGGLRGGWPPGSSSPTDLPVLPASLRCSGSDFERIEEMYTPRSSSAPVDVSRI